MRIQIASFALVPEHIYIAERNFHAEKLILILSEENKNAQGSSGDEVVAKIQEVKEFYGKMNILVEEFYLNYKDFMEMTSLLAQLLMRFSSVDEILLNLSGGRRSIPISLIYAGTFISNFKAINIKCVVIPEDKTFSPFNLFPNYLPDKVDLKLMSRISNKTSLTNLEDYLGIKQPTISMRLKKLELHGYVIINRRNRRLSDLGQLVVDINRSKLKNETDDFNH